MPAGVSWGQYLKFMACAMASMMAGSQLVHMYYNPLKDLDKYIDKELKSTGLALPGTSMTDKENGNAT